MAYGDYFDIVRLTNELTVLYKTERFQQKHIFELIAYLKENNFDDAMPEIFKLCALILAIP